MSVSGAIKGKAPEDAVFTWPDGDPVLDFRGTWTRLTKEAGMPNLLVHDLRAGGRTFAWEKVLRVPFDKNEGVVKAQLSGPVV
jgi:hypothetical protein